MNNQNTNNQWWRLWYVKLIVAIGVTLFALMIFAPLFLLWR